MLLRASEPIHGMEHMRSWREADRQLARLLDLTQGADRLTAALRVDRRDDGLNLFEPGQLWIGSAGHRVGEKRRQRSYWPFKGPAEQTALFRGAKSLLERGAGTHCGPGATMI